MGLITGCDTDPSPGGGEDGGSGGIDTIGSTDTDSAGGDTETAGTDSQGTNSGSDTNSGTDTDPSGGESDTDGDSDTDGESDADSSSDSDSDSDSASDSDTDSGNDATLLFLEVDPPETILELDLNMASSVDFTVTAVYSDGSTIDVTGDATWDVSNAGVGAMDGATLEIPSYPDSFFESAILTADVGGETGQAQVTIAAYDFASDFFFVLPFEDEAGPQGKPLTFSTDVKAMDVFINMDTTGSMAGEINNLRNALGSDIIPTIQAEVPNTQFGAGSFDDFPVTPYGSTATDQPFVLLQEITNNVADVQAAVNTYSAAGGADGPESGVEALYQIATGDGLAGPAPTSVPANNSGIGGVGFREGSLPIVVSITDNITHDTESNACGGEQYTGAVAAEAHSQTQAMDAMNAICGRVIQIAIGGEGTCSAYEDGVQWNNATGALVPPEAWDVVGRPPGCAAGQCCTGLSGAGRAPDGAGLCPMTFTASASGTGVDSSFSSAVPLLASYGSFDVTSQVTGVDTDVDGGALPMGTTTADFIQAVTPFDHGPVPLPGVADPTLTPTTFENVIPDTDVTFTVTAFNDFVEQGPDARLFTANISVLADDCGDLDDRDVFILVPPEELPPPG